MSKYPKKSTPKGINFAAPNKNFVETWYDNHNESRAEYYDYLYSGTLDPNNQHSRKASHFGHSIGQRAGKLRLSGTPGAHRIGKRK